MNDNLQMAFEEMLTIDFIEATISNSTNVEAITKIKIRPVMIKDIFLFQVTKYCNNQVFHSNCKKEEIIAQLQEWFFGEYVHFKQAELKSKSETIHILISKKGKVTIKKKKNQKEEIPICWTHNRQKEYILQEGMKIPFLQDLGVMTNEGKIVHAKYDKFKQINRFLEFIENILPRLSKEQENVILDFGCGKSYLTFAMYYYLKEIKQYPIQIIGLDLKKDVIRHCNLLRDKYGYENLHFLEADIADYEGVDHVDMVVTLHACDTATDYALYKAVQWGAEVILSVPCCQHELNQNMKCQELQSIFRYGVIQERTAALLTDALRANVLEMMGYQTQILEFIDMEHTPKNLLIRGVKKQKRAKNKFEQQKQEYMQMVQLLGYEPLLGRLFQIIQ